jgi:S-adenosylmethionine hydrolase
MQTVVFIEDNYVSPHISIMAEVHLKMKYKNIAVIRIPVENYIYEPALIINSYIPSLPNGTVFFSLSDLKIGKKTGLLYFSYGGHHIILPDNGSIGYIYGMDYNKVEVRRIIGDFFIDYNSLWQTLLHITDAIANNKIDTISVIATDYAVNRLTSPQVRINGFNTNLLFFSREGSMICDLKYDDFIEKSLGYGSFKMIVKEKMLEITKLSLFPMENAYGDPYAIFNNYGLLEIGLVKSNLKETFKIGNPFIVKIDFYE